MRFPIELEWCKTKCSCHIKNQFGWFTNFHFNHFQYNFQTTKINKTNKLFHLLEYLPLFQEMFYLKRAAGKLWNNTFYWMQSLLLIWDLIEKLFSITQCLRLHLQKIFFKFRILKGFRRVYTKLLYLYILFFRKPHTKDHLTICSLPVIYTPEYYQLIKNRNLFVVISKILENIW